MAEPPAAEPRVAAPRAATAAAAQTWAFAWSRYAMTLADRATGRDLASVRARVPSDDARNRHTETRLVQLAQTLDATAVDCREVQSHLHTCFATLGLASAVEAETAGPTRGLAAATARIARLRRQVDPA
ncbi:hypothetical protein CXG81DRAFT_23345 [Caulochytrium protostelioides]|uniref:Uncharacterized protein n=1 Tax=Caulochytrium protostelioides TaxID=1555241 RepID=A0A4P9XEW9_9FUNG|nr:hypothetical protein CXG81DRAFT_23345 [Caulochytrium protostelioides]|eukprot:RKP04088.1 hypothetical protein CXG81DRAFT_23345 [Caulochytrium protostelioides]